MINRRFCRRVRLLLLAGKFPVKLLCCNLDPLVVKQSVTITLVP
ncbi:hypothetical protein PLANPX_0091 [Lacipirellula parvula]|uniref:Uncharacterized protein n=1 Tax=Lacipirellula parvula TaxID=2650471 RepID=A0A5K7XBK2_9BACT|nr:hypothetical protein PLANPX_0091 [Lacipirellula parvula]